MIKDPYDPLVPGTPATLPGPVPRLNRLRPAAGRESRTKGAYHIVVHDSLSGRRGPRQLRSSECLAFLCRRARSYERDRLFRPADVDMLDVVNRRHAGDVACAAAAAAWRCRFQSCTGVDRFSTWLAGNFVCPAS
jgi:hypothetical protein